MKNGIVSIIISITALLIMCAAHIVFIVRIRSGHIKPNASSWGAWVFATAVNVFSYSAMSKDIIVASWTFMIFTMCAIVFVYALLKRSFSRMTIPDWLLLTLSIIATLTLYFSHDAKSASLILSVACVIPLLPTIIGLRNNPSNENSLPWIMLAIGYALVTVNVIMRWKGEWGNLAMPVLIFVGNSCVVWLSSSARKRRMN